MTYQTAVHLFAFLGLDLPQVELQLLALQDVAVCSAALAGSGGDASCMKEDGSSQSCYQGQYIKFQMCGFDVAEIYLRQ